MQNIFLSNLSNIKFLTKLKDSLNQCNSFCFSVSFIKKAGLCLIIEDIENALKRGAKGKIITSTYQNFTDLWSLEKFLEFKRKYNNFDCHLDFNSFEDNGYHSKGYIFDYEGETEFIVGSTNITRFALLKNIEWNVSLKSDKDFSSICEAKTEFNFLWKHTNELSVEQISKYKTALMYAVTQWDMDYFDPSTPQFKANKMQNDALRELMRFRDLGQNKSLVISAMGSGKTYLAAFDAKHFCAKRVLFIAHRDKILLDAKETFIKVFGPEKTYGLFLGNAKQADCDFVFASNILLSQHLNLFDPNQFDYIVLDECHHAVATSYKKIIEYFKPGFVLGLTATPERMDNGNIFELFDNNVPYELRLRDAIINDIVVPFHYYGITDQLVNYGLKDSNEISRQISRAQNLDLIKSEINLHKPSGKLKAIAFCTNVAHAQLMADQFNSIGYKAVALTGANSSGERIKGCEDLQNDSNPLEIICTVDIFNEGVDIPKVNMVLFLRPTESSTIFLQQLGRGLRKSEGKQFLTVLDFIGNNYSRSVQIAMALGSLGNSTCIEKQYLKDLIRSDFKDLQINGVEIHIDHLAKEQLINHIHNTNFNSKNYLKKDYENFKSYIKQEKYPSHMDYLNNDCAPDLMRFIKSTTDGSKNRSYYTFLAKINEQTLPLFDKNQIELIDKISDYLPITRPDEFMIIKQLIENDSYDFESIKSLYPKTTDKTLNNALFFLNKDLILLNNKIDKQLIMDDRFRNHLMDIIDYGLKRFQIEFGNFEGDFKIYGNYSKSQVMRTLLELTDQYMQGTKYNTQTGETYLFVGLKKDQTKLERLNYKDKFISPNLFQWESVNNTTKTNKEGEKLLNTKKVHLFIRKLDSEDGIRLPFTYFGSGKFTNMRETHNNNSPTLTFDVMLDMAIDKKYRLDFEVPTIS